VSGLDQLNRAQAARLLQLAQEARALAVIGEAMALADGEWQHPATLERIERSHTLERCIEGLLAARAGVQRAPGAPGESGRPLGSGH
jgi:hypothetical protein